MIQIIRVGEKSPTAVIRVSSTTVGTPPPQPSPDPVPVPVNPSQPFVGSQERWWQGEGPPPDLILGAQVGDFYWDTVSGNVFELTEGM